MGNIQICGSLCDSCEVSRPEKADNSQPPIEQILIKEIYEREKTSKLISEEVNKMKKNFDHSLEKIKSYCENKKTILQKDLTHLEETSNKSFTEIRKNIDKIKEDHLSHIERDLDVMKSKLDNLNEDIKEMKDVIKDLNKNTIKNSTQLEILNSK